MLSLILSSQVTVALLTMKSAFKYHAVPKLEQHTYLQATTTNNSDYPLLAGPAAVFFDNNFVAQSQLRAVNPGETFDSFLGVDGAVKVSYPATERLRETGGVFRSTQTEVFTQRIVLKNTKTIEAEITVQDQFPQSTDKEIKVKLLEPDLAAKALPYQVKINQQNNLEWTVNLAPGVRPSLPVLHAPSS